MALGGLTPPTSFMLRQWRCGFRVFDNCQIEPQGITATLEIRVSPIFSRVIASSSITTT